jgi:hypothetical protein
VRDRVCKRRSVQGTEIFYCNDIDIKNKSFVGFIQV